MSVYVEAETLFGVEKRKWESSRAEDIEQAKQHVEALPRKLARQLPGTAEKDDDAPQSPAASGDSAGQTR